MHLLPPLRVSAMLRVVNGAQTESPRKEHVLNDTAIHNDLNECECKAGGC